MTGQQLCEAARDGDAAKVSTLQAAQSFINYQGARGATPLCFAAAKGHETVTKQLLAARCNVNLQTKERPIMGMLPSGSNFAARCKLEPDLQNVCLARG